MTTELSHQQAVEYLRDAAIRAHLDGQGAKARQLAALALRKGASRGSLPIVNLEHLVWAFFLIIYWMLEEEDFSIALDGAWESFKKKNIREEKARKVSEDDHWHPIIGFLIDVLRPDALKWDADIKALKDIPTSFFTEKKDQYANEIFCMILPLVVDFVHYLYPDKKDALSSSLIWHSLCSRWESHASYAKNETLLKTIITTRKRIEKQHACLLEPGAFPYNAENALEEFWNAFYEIDIAEMKRIIPRLTELTKLAQEDTNRFYPIQSLINMTRFIIGTDATDQLPGVYRVQRLYMENPQWLFGRLRSMKFSEVLNNFYFEAQQRGVVGINTVQIWRLPLIAEITALENWDLQNYLNSIKMQSKAWLFLGLLPVDHKEMTPADCNAEDLSTGIHQAVKGLALHDDKTRHFNDVRRAFHNLELNSDAKKKIESLLESLVKSIRPLERASAAYLFAIMSDTIPKIFLKQVFIISIEAFRKKEFLFDATMLNWWEDVFKWADLDKTEWDTVEPSLTDLFKNSISWRTSDAMLKEALINAPIVIAEKWANVMAGNLNRDDLHKYGMPILYNAALERFELKEYVLRVLDFLKDDPAIADLMAYDRALLLAADEEKSALDETPAGKKCRFALIGQLLRYAQSVADRNEQPRHLIIRPPFQWQLFQRISWSKLGQGEWAQIDRVIKEAVENLYCTEQDFVSLILVWSIIASQQKKSVIDKAGKWLIDLYWQPPRTDGPLSQMFGISGVKDSLRFVKTVALSPFLHKVSSSVCKDMLAWIQDEIPEAEKGNQPILWEMLLALYITGTHVQSIWALNALKAIYSRIADNNQLLAEAIEKSYNVFVEPHVGKGRRMIDILRNKKDKDIDLILITLDKVIGKLIQAPIPNGRKAAAIVLNLFMEIGWINEQRAKWIENLKEDPRARISATFKA